MYVKKTIGVIGGGFVGQHVAKFFKNHHDVYVHDVKEKLCSGWSGPYYNEYDSDYGDAKANRMEFIARSCDFVFICVNTPKAEDGSCGLGALEEVINDLNARDTKATIVIKSTVEPGTTERLSEQFPERKIVFSPEYASMSKYWSPHGIDRDMVEAPYYIFASTDDAIADKVYGLYLQIGGPTKKYFITEPKTAEMVKYTTNCFYAVKVAFCNELKEICDKSGLRWNDIRELWLNDPRISPMHTAVFDENRGFGGACFLKDTEALRSFSRKNDFDPKILDATIEENKEFRKKNNDNSDDPYEV